MKLRGLDYEVRTYGSGKPILLLHGFTSDAEWVKQLPALDGEVFSVSLPHHGATAPCSVQRSRMSEQVRDLLSLLETRSEPWTVIGYSMGGRVGMTLALCTDRIDHFIGISTTPGIENAVERRERRQGDEQLARKLDTEPFSEFLDFWEQLPLWRQTDAMKALLRKERLRQDPSRLAASLRAVGTGNMPSLWKRLNRLPRTSLIVGSDDTKFVDIAERVRSLHDHCHVYKISDSGHAPHIENAQKFGTIIKKLI